MKAKEGQWRTLLVVWVGVLLFTASPLQAQFFGGLEAGVSSIHTGFGGYYYYDLDNYYTSTDAIFRFTGGLRAEIALDSDMRLVAGLRYIQRGGEYDIGPSYPNGSTTPVIDEYTVEYDYLEIPIGAKVLVTELPWQLYFGMNAIAAINLRAESMGPERLDEPDVDFSEFTRDFLPFVDFLAGVETPLGKRSRILLEARYTRNILSLEKDNNTTVHAPGFVFVLGILYQFNSSAEK